MATVDVRDGLHVTVLQSLLSLPPKSPVLAEFLQSLVTDSSVATPKIQSYPDTTYHTYNNSLSLTYIPTPANPSTLCLDRIDILNPIDSAPTRRRAPPSPPFPKPLKLVFPTTSITLPPVNDQSPQTVTRPKIFVITRNTTGRDLVEVLGEPSKKGGMEGWVGLWLEWGCVELERREGEVVKLGMMVELRDTGKEATEEEMKKGQGGVWERAAKWEWASLKVFQAEEGR
jgi:hypothetical protein